MTIEESALREELIVDDKDPLSIARKFLKWQYLHREGPTLRFFQGVFYVYGDGFYRSVEPQEVRSRLYAFLELAMIVVDQGGKNEREVPFKPTKHNVDNVVDALKAIVSISASSQPPVWLEPTQEDLAVEHIVICGNGFLHLPTGQLYPATPRLFALDGLPVVFDPNSPQPKHWLRFLAELWPQDRPTIKTLQEWMGYLLTQDTRQQKILLIIGPTRSGKGTIARVVRGLIGSHGHCAPTLSTLEQHFGLETLIGKSVAVIPDARTGTGGSTSVERLLNISGEDEIDVPRKHLRDWTGKLHTRLMILSNELPILPDASGAVTGRFLILKLTKTFFGVEDTELTQKLLGELPGVFTWAIEGWKRLSERGFFVQPPSSDEYIERMEELGSPVLAFIRQRCEIGPGKSVRVEFLYTAWGKWCDLKDHTKGTPQSFGRELRGVLPGLRITQPRVNRMQIRNYEGISLKVTDTQ